MSSDIKLLDDSVVLEGNVGIGTPTPRAPLHVASYMAVGPFAATTGTGGIDVTGPTAELGFVRRDLKAWPSKPAAGDRFVWYNPNGSARLWTEAKGDLLTVSKEGNVDLEHLKITGHEKGVILESLGTGVDPRGHRYQGNLKLSASSLEFGGVEIYSMSQMFVEKSSGTSDWIVMGGPKLAITPDGIFSRESASRLVFSSDGVTINGNVSIPNGELKVRGDVLHADYVFESDYQVESIQEHAEFMWKNKHLKSIQPVTRDESGLEVVEVGSHFRSILEELEKAHIYIDQLHKQNKVLEERLALIEERLGKVG